MRCAARGVMVVKSVRGRRRYIFFEVPQATRRDDLTAMLESIASVKVITCSGGEAVVRCSPVDRDETIGRVSASGGRSVKTSGTLRTLRDEYPSLRVPQKRRR